ncbi:MAG: OB-fold nucleic acid binding domain-containing protein, partial [Candidatus Zixiibacteriota bacterium]
MSDKKIKDFVIDDNITSFFAVRKKAVREYIKGKFVSLELGDCSGRVNAVIWEPDQFSMNDLTEGVVVKVRGIVNEYRNKKQLTINKIRLAKDDEYTPEDILPYSKQSRGERKARIITLTEKIQNSYIKSLVESFWDDEQFLIKYL